MTTRILPLALLAILAAACSAPESPDASRDIPVGPAAFADSANAVATFAGGCFWCMEGPFDVLDGVLATTSGFTGGHVENPSYAQVTRGGTGHFESVQILYDSTRITYAELLDVYWVNVDPLDAGGQFCDRGDHYRAAVFYHDADQRRLAEASRQRVAGRFDADVVAQILPAGEFYAAGEEHQGFYLKNPDHYRRYRASCGRDARLAELWGYRR
jgi:peptide-methionine (S)-S-oxide reductase